FSGGARAARHRDRRGRVAGHRVARRGSAGEGTTHATAGCADRRRHSGTPRWPCVRTTARARPCRGGNWSAGSLGVADTACRGEDRDPGQLRARRVGGDAGDVGGEGRQEDGKGREGTVWDGRGERNRRTLTVSYRPLPSLT